jgi:hypothetical protein
MTLNFFFKNKIGRESFNFSFHDRLNIINYSVALLQFTHAKSQPLRFATATTSLIFQARFIHK